MFEFIKMHGIGNDYIYIDCIANPMPDNIEQFSRHASDRHKGIGGDGVVLIQPSDIADCRMRMFNADGSEGRMCGNAIRCVGKYYYETYIAKTRDTRHKTRDTRHETRDTRHETRDNCELCIVNCASAVSMGNPHLILPIDDIDNYPLHQLGPLWENHPLFPDRVNTEIVEQLSPTHLRMRVWERGSGETLACGTGACAIVVAFTHLNRVPKGEPITVSLRGGDLIITYCNNNHVLMQGTATEVFRGTINF